MMQVLPRKIVSAAIASVIFAVVFGAMQPNPFGEEIYSMRSYIDAFLIATPAYLLYSFPVILLYGSLTSTLSDFFSSVILKNKQGKAEYFLSLFFHLLFGLLFLWTSLTASFIYFLTDRFLSKKKSTYKWRGAFKSPLIPLLLWILFMGTNSLMDFVENWTDYIV